MNYLSVEQLSKSYDSRQLFSGATFGINQGQKVALVGRNGSGKSTLMRIIAGQEAPDTGQVVFRKGIKVGFLSQNPLWPGALTIQQAIFHADNDIANLVLRYEKALMQQSDDLTALMEEMETSGAWDYEVQMKEVLGKLGINQLDQRVHELSGGQRKRLALAEVLLEKPDFLILDEPTNHLDLDVIEWLQQYLSTANQSLLLVTHDRYFLEDVTNEIVEIDKGKLYTYQGNYSYYLEKKTERQQQEAAGIDKAKNLMRKELDWIRRQPKARGTKAKYRLDAFEELKEKASQSTEVSSLQFQIQAKRLGKKVMEVHDIGKAWDNEVLFEHFNYIFQRKDRVGVIGKNGSGKTSFLNIITGRDEDFKGEIELGDTVEFGYFTQEKPPFSDDQRVIDVVKEVAEVITLKDGGVVTASQFLQQFLFTPEMQYTYVGKLSGGEKKRLQLLRVLIRNPNFLILDEPTNDLDLTTLTVLEEYLYYFEGVLIVVSHDRFFMDRLVKHCFVLGQKQIRDYPGNYSQYRAARELELENTQQEKKGKKAEKVKQPQRDKPKTRLSYKEKKEFEELEKEIEALEAEKAGLVSKMNDADVDHAQLMDWSQRVESINAELETKSDRWLELSEFV
ncbi:MAG TPA: ABC transporter [Flavobacteriales bacterium]|jgi:ATP-binding cassette subfamily F protein uup|nr:ABC transporter [Flavobacteriales bacterium]